MLAKAGGVEIWDEDWSGEDNMKKIRPGRTLSAPQDLFSLWETCAVILPAVLRRYGVHGLLHLKRTNVILERVYNDGALGYSLMRAKKPQL